MSANISRMKNYSEFVSLCRYEKCEKEYPGWVGDEKYIVYSALSREQLDIGYPEIMKALSPYVLISPEMKRAIGSYQYNERKYTELFSLTTSFEELRGNEPAIYPALDQVDISELDALTKCQKRRLEWHYFDGLSYGEIAQKEGISKNAVKCSIHGALNILKKFF